ncbi:MAG: rod shape-determining protein RodA [Gammaproteobacteria bacterium]|nr:rod shape-determining protein RodA [Gammaproteobacteria bacterium]
MKSLGIPLSGVASSPGQRRGLLARLHLDGPLLLGLFVLGGLGMAVLFSAGGGHVELVVRQLVRIGLAVTVMVLLAQIPPRRLYEWAPWLFVAGTGLLVAVLAFGDIGKGAQRWLDLGFVRFQPSEAMKLAVPMMVARHLARKPLPPGFWRLLGGILILVVPTLLIAKQPDLGTSILIASSGFFVLFLGGMSWRLLGGATVLAVPGLWVLWEYGMKEYQRQRVLTFLNPQEDPLGSGYHIIQSTIAIGSGGVYGKGWLNGTQAHLDFLPERSTDFIFAVFGEEFGLIGALILLLLYVLIVGRGLYIAALAQDSFSRLLAGSISLTFLVYLLVNTGMVSGLLPVVGVPLPLVSYGGTSLVTLMAGFGILMSIHTHRRLLPT